MRTRSGGTLHHAALVRSDADRALALEDLDVEAVLALVDDLAQRRADDAPGALERAGDVLDAHLEAHCRLAVGQLLEREARRGVLHHPDHPGGREDLDRQRSGDVGQQLALDNEVLLASQGHAISILARLVDDPVAIIGGTGALGYGLAIRWVRAGVPVVIGSRDADRAREAAQRTGAQEGLENGEAAKRAEIV